MLDHPHLLRRFTTQYWVATVDQLVDLGASRDAIRRQCRHGVLVRLVPGVVGVAGGCDGFLSRAMAAQLAAGDRGFLSGRTAGTLHGLRRMASDRIEVTVPETWVRAWPAWVAAVRTSWSDDEPRPARNDALRLASPPRTLFGLAALLDQARFEQAAEDMWHRGLLTPTLAREYLQRVRRRGRTGVARFEAWLERVEGLAAPVASGLEALLVDLVRRAGLPEPHRQFPLRLTPELVIHLDLAWPELRLAVEPGHSWWHGGDVAMRADQERDRWCAARGWLVVRYDESVWERRDATVAELRRLYRARRRSVASASSL